MKNVYILYINLVCFEIMIFIGNIFLYFSEMDIDSAYVSDPLS